MKYLILLISVSFILSCRTKVYDSIYKGESNYYNFYVVDTISIDDPIVISSVKYGGKFIGSRTTLKNIDGKNVNELFFRPDVFLFGDDFYVDLPVEKISKYKYRDYGGCRLEDSQENANGIRIFEFKSKPQKFVLGLINANFFYKMHTGFDMKQFVLTKKNNKILFYKIVYPICK